MTSRKRSKVALTSMTFTRPTRVQEPTKEAPGIFENLQMIVGAGWDPTSDCAKMLDQSWENGGLFIFNERESSQIRSSMGKAMTEEQNFRRVDSTNKLRRTSITKLFCEWPAA